MKPCAACYELFGVISACCREERPSTYTVHCLTGYTWGVKLPQ